MGARETAIIATSWCSRCMAKPLKPSAIAEHAGQTAFVLRAEHEVIYEELRASFEQIGEGRRALVGLEMVLLINSNPWQPLPLLRQFVTTPRQLLLGLQQLQPSRKPLITRSDLVFSHCSSSPCLRKSNIS